MTKHQLAALRVSARRFTACVSLQSSCWSGGQPKGHEGRASSQEVLGPPRDALQRDLPVLPWGPEATPASRAAPEIAGRAPPPVTLRACSARRPSARSRSRVLLRRTLPPWGHTQPLLVWTETKTEALEVSKTHGNPFQKPPQHCIGQSGSCLPWAPCLRL